MAVHDHIYGHMLLIIQRLVAVLHAHVIIVVPTPHPHLLVAITTVSQEIQILLQSRAFCILVMLFGMVNSAVQKVPAAAMDNPLRGLV